MDTNPDSPEDNPFQEKFDFPEQLLNNISECSPEGYLLFIINERGEVEVFKSHSADVVESGLRVKAMKILASLSMIEDNDITSSILHQTFEKDEEETEEGLE